MSNSGYSNPRTDERYLADFCDLFCVTATIQGRLAYFIMSIHAVHPGIFNSLFPFDPHHILFANMVYGIAVNIYSRPGMRTITFVHRCMFGILGSLMFNHSSMLMYGWLVGHYSHRPWLLSFLGFISGRIMMIHLMAYLYHVDTRTRSYPIRPTTEFELMYRYPNRRSSTEDGETPGRYN